MTNACKICQNCISLKGIRGICADLGLTVNIKNIERFHDCDRFLRQKL